MKREPGRRTASRTWFCLPVAIVGVTASLVLGFVVSIQEDIRIKGGLEIQAARLANGIEKRLDEGMRPISILALFLETDGARSPERFAAMALKVKSLGIPIGRMNWVPRVPDEQREAFEAEARAAGLSDYRIVKLTPDGNFVPADREPEYFPIRLETTTLGFPGALGYDVVSDPTRRAIAELARDLGEPVALRTRLIQVELLRTPAYTIYWPLYRDGTVPASVAERRRLLSGYVTAAVRLDELLNHALRDSLPSVATAVFRARNPTADSRMDPVGWYTPDTELTIYQPGMSPPSLPIHVFEQRFVLLHHAWVLSIAFPDAVATRLRDSMPLLAGSLGLTITLALTGLVYLVGFQAERDRGRRRQTEDLMADLEQTNQALTISNAHLGDRERASIGLAHARTRFLASASHDLRQPLHALALFTSALTRRVTDPSAAELVANIHALGLSMQGMFTSLLDLSRLDTGSIQVRIGPCDLDALIGRLLVEYTPRARAKNLSVRKAGRFPVLDTDPSLLESVLRNLLDNAIKFTDRGGILIASRTRRGARVIEIWDTGPGIPAQQQDRIFEEFERLEDSSAKPGFGLGLPIVRKLCALIGASVSVCSRPGHGSLFAVTLPLRGVPAMPATVGQRNQARPVETKSILLVDDDTSVSRALTVELVDCGHRVFAATNTADGLRLIQSSHMFDIAILDLRLGGKHDGWALADAWRARRPGRPVVLMTGSTDAETLRRVRDSGLPVLFKPVAPHILHGVIASPSDWV
jgi:signal transduction histidine kinase